VLAVGDGELDVGSNEFVLSRVVRRLPRAGQAREGVGVAGKSYERLGDGRDHMPDFRSTGNHCILLDRGGTRNTCPRTGPIGIMDLSFVREKCDNQVKNLPIFKTSTPISKALYSNGFKL